MPIKDREARLAYQRAYSRRFAVRERVNRKAREARDENRAARLEIQRRYRATPEGRAARRRYREKNRVAANLAQRIGVSIAVAREILKTKPLVCDICGHDRPLCYDHCHVSGRHRGWLCNHCNTAIGHFFDNPEHLRAAAAYLDERG